MPEAFERCRKAGGRIRTMSGPNKRMRLEAGEFMRVCFNKNGSMVRGEKKRKGSGVKSK